MAEIIPAILESEFSEIKKKIEQVDGLVNWIELDISDGLFATAYTWEHFQDLLELPGKAKIEVHLMVEQPEHYIGDWMKVADRIIVHDEATERLPVILQQFEAQVGGVVGLGLALLPETSIAKLEDYRGKIKLVQLMGIKHIARQGQPFEEITIARVRELRALMPEVTIAVDGGINLENAKRLIEAGADNLVIGSAIWEAKNISETIKEFQKL